MITQTEGRIILSDTQAHTQTPTYHRTFIWEKSESDLYSLDYLEKVLLLPNQVYSLPVASSHAIMIIPFIGDLHLCNKKLGTLLIEENQSYSINTTEYTEIVNPYLDEMVTFFIVKYEDTLDEVVYDISIQELPNQLLPINPSTSSWIGQFGGRQKGELKLQSPHRDLLAYIIDGAFEVQDRLLHADDALILNSVDLVDFEALSEQAIILLFELKTKRG